MLPDLSALISSLSILALLIVSATCFSLSAALVVRPPIFLSVSSTLDAVTTSGRFVPALLSLALLFDLGLYSVAATAVLFTAVFLSS